MDLFFSVLALQRYGVTLEQMEVVLMLLLVFHEAMKGSGRRWPDQWAAFEALPPEPKRLAELQALPPSPARRPRTAASYRRVSPGVRVGAPHVSRTRIGK